MYRPHESYLKCTDKPGIVLVLLYSVWALRSQFSEAAGGRIKPCSEELNNYYS
jgi:hypothetical protein